MPTLVRDETGAYFVDTGGGTYQPVSEEQARTFQGGQGAGQGAFQAAGQGLENLITGAGSLLSDAPYWQQANTAGREQSDALNLANPVTSAAAQYAPQVLAGAATAGAGLPTVMGVEGALGAATTPESPLMGAAIGAGTAGLAELAPGAAAALYGRGRDLAQQMPWFRPRDAMSKVLPNPGGRLPDEMPPTGAAGAGPEPGGGPIPPGGPVPTPSPSANPPGAAPNPAPRMAERVTQNLDAADPNGQQVATTRVMEGTLTPAELYARGVPTTQAQRKMLTARGEAERAAARDELGIEEKAASHPIFGGNARAVRDAQQQSATNFIVRELGVPEGTNLTDPVLSDVVADVGGRLDQIAGEMGTVPLTQEIRDEFANILTHSTGPHSGQIQGFVDQINKKAELNGGVLTGDDWQEMRTQIVKMIDAGTRQGQIGKVSDAHELMETMTSAMESGLPDATREELAKLRRQYAIAATLDKPGARNADGQVNPLSFYNNWKRGQSKKTKGTDDLGRFMNTIVTLTQKRTPDSGTAGRLLQNAAGLATDLIPGGQTARRVLGI